MPYSHISYLQSWVLRWKTSAFVGFLILQKFFNWRIIALLCCVEDLSLSVFNFNLLYILPSLDFYEALFQDLSAFYSFVAYICCHLLSESLITIFGCAK